MRELAGQRCVTHYGSDPRALTHYLSPPPMGGRRRRVDAHTEGRRDALPPP